MPNTDTPHTHSPSLDPLPDGPLASFFPLPSKSPSAALTHTHLEMLLKANWQNLGHGAVGEYGLLLSLGLQGSACPGFPRERRRRGRGGRLSSEGYSPGTQGTGRQTRELGSGAEAPGAGRAAMAEPGAAQTPETAEPCGRIPGQNSAQPPHPVPLM